MTGRVILVALGAVGALIGLALAAVGLVLLVISGRDGAFGGGDVTLSTPTYAMVTDGAGLGDGDLDGTVRIRVSSTDGGEVFVGVAPAAAVDAYLAGTGFEELRDLRLSPLRYVPLRSGSQTAPSRPEGREWTVSATGPGEQSIVVPVGGGRQQRLVVMNADAAADIEVTAAVSLRAAFVRRLAIGLLVAGAVVAPVGGVALAAGVRRSVRPGGE